MKLLDTMVIVYARTPGSPFHSWAKSVIASAVVAPLPDFFIGAHAETIGCEVVTNDQGRFANYFPTVKLVTP